MGSATACFLANQPGRGPDKVPRTGLWLRVFVSLLLAVLPPILLVVGALLLTRGVLRGADPNLVAILIVVSAITWAAILGVVYSRSLADELHSFLRLAQRGEHSPDVAGSAYAQVADALAERNQQIATLAREAGRIPIDEEPQRVLRALVSATRSVMRDATWRAAVLSSDDPGELPAGIYPGIDEDDRVVTPIGDLEQWASLTSQDSATRAEGPWGAFAVADASASERVRTILYAPWEGRGDVTRAERSLLALVAQYAGTALEHSLLYARVRKQAGELSRLASVQSDFLRGVTHDLQTPLTSIGALAAELRANDAVPDSARSDLDTIAHQAERLRRMVGQLLVASRLEAGAFTPEVDVFTVPPLIERTWAALRSTRPFRLTVNGAPHLAVGDPDRVEQVMWAVLDNALKYSPPDTPIEVAVNQGDGRVSTSVRDHGAGMDSETARRAFDQFYRSTHARRLAPDGSGVGLYMARGLIEAMGGSISLSSRTGEGTAVTISLPGEISAGAD